MTDLVEPRADPDSAYERLHPSVQRWVWEQKWDRLRTVQAHAIDPILAGRDVVIAAATASGKTEAAWLPACTTIAAGAPAGNGGVKALYLGPLKALINDQYLRLESLGKAARIPVHRWHGDVAASRKRALVKNPDGVLLITPESLEALFVREGPRIATVFAALHHVIIDELHDFIGTERGAQLQSLLHRLDLAVRRHVPRIGLSATLADLGIAADFLHPRRGGEVHIIDNPGGDTAEIRMQLRGYVRTDPRERTSENAPDLDDAPVHANDAQAIADHLYTTLRGEDNLVFANSRSAVEAYVDLLRQMSEQNVVPNEFFPHHGNLSKEYREDVERRLRTTETPTTAVCTSTLEMGIDIGSTDSVAQLGAPHSVAALRQRLGRAGRRGRAAVLRLYVAERELTDRTPPADQIRAELVQTVAMVNLMLYDRWFEPPNTGALHLSTLTQQILSVIAQHGGATAGELYTTLCATGPFAHVPKARFAALLTDLGATELLTQSSDGLLLHGPRGDQIVNHYTFYTAFATSEEYRLVARGRTLGSIPVDYPVLVGSLLIFAGRRWKVVDVDSGSRVIELTRSGGGRPPAFSGGGAEVADVVRQRMRTFYESAEVAIYLDATARTLLDEGRASYRRLRLGERSLVDWGNDTLLFAWRGDRILNTLAIALAARGLRVSLDGVALHVSDSSVQTVHRAIRDLAERLPPEPVALAATVRNKHREKYDEYLSPDLLAHAYAAHSLDVSGAWDALRDLARQVPESYGGNGSPARPRDMIAEPVPTPTYPRLGETPFAVVDIETTGFAGHADDRIVEIAVVHADPSGGITDRWTTLVNAGRDPGPTGVHGIRAEDLEYAPYFAELTAWFTHLTAGRVLVAHNAPYDTAFLTAEYERADMDAPDWATLCTMELARRLDEADSSSLASCCAAAGISHNGAHTALGDAEATARLLQYYLTAAAENEINDFPSLGCHRAIPQITGESTPVAGRLQPRAAATLRSAPRPPRRAGG